MDIQSIDRLTSSTIKNLKILGLIVLAAYAALIVICSLPTFIDKWPIATFDLGQGKSLSIQASTGFYEISRPVYFEVREGFFKVVNPGCFIAHESLDYPKYSVVFAENRSMVGVLVSRYELSPELSIMCDLVSNKCWPCDANDKERENLFERLEHDNPNLSRPWGLSP